MKCCFAFFLLFCLTGCDWRGGRIVTGLEGKTLPAFNLTLADSVTGFNTNTIPEGKPFILFFYQPYCPFCRAQTEEIVKNIKRLMNVPIYMVTSWPYKDIRQFVANYQLNQYPNITIIRDPRNQMQTYFQPQGVPFMAFYDPQRRLTRAVLGKHDIGELKSNMAN